MSSKKNKKKINKTKNNNSLKNTTKSGVSKKNKNVKTVTNSKSDKPNTQQSKKPVSKSKSNNTTKPNETKKITQKVNLKSQEIVASKEINAKKQSILVNNQGKNDTQISNKEASTKIVAIKKSQINNKRKSHATNIARTKNSEIISEIKKLHRKIKIYGIKSVISLKNIAVITCAMVMFFGIILGIKLINRNNYDLDLYLISEEIDQLKTVKYNLDSTNSIITDSKSYTNLRDYYEYDYLNIFYLDPSWLKEEVIKYNKSNKQVFIAIMPTDGNEENIKEAVKKFMSKNKISKYEELDYDGYQFFINSSNNKAVISKIKQSQIRVFDILQELKKSDIEKEFGISYSMYKEAMVKKSMLKSDTTGYIIMKPSNKSSKEKIIEQMNSYYDKVKEDLITKNDLDNLNLLNNRYFGEYNGYLIFIVSRDNNLVLQLINK